MRKRARTFIVVVVVGLSEEIVLSGIVLDIYYGWTNEIEIGWNEWNEMKWSWREFDMFLGGR